MPKVRLEPIAILDEQDTLVGVTGRVSVTGGTGGVASGLANRTGTGV